jgi:moderate conductance mechanosensitive channel
MFDGLPEPVQSFLESHTVAVLAILLMAYIAQILINRVTSRVISRTVRNDPHLSSSDEQKREKTLKDIIHTTLNIVIWTGAFLLILSELGVNIAPLIAGAGVVGLAVGFGAQSLVKDAVNGLFIISENQYRVGDVVSINNDTAGVVEKITLRQTVLRDLDGMVHHIPNGYIEMATNMTMEYANVNIDIGVSYATDFELLEKVINDVGETMAQDDEWKDKIIEAPKFLRVDSFGDSAIMIKILGKTTSELRWGVAGELRKRLKIAFDKHGIEIPFNQVVVHQAPEPKTKSSDSKPKK